MAASSESLELAITTWTEQVPAKGLEKIPYYDKHPSLGGTLSYLSHEAFQAKFGCEYSESLWLTEKSKHLTREETQTELNHLTVILRDLLKSPLNKFSICYIDDIVGHVLIALEDLDPIDHPILFMYAGVIQQGTTYDESRNPYCMSYDNEKRTQNTTIAISAEKKGGLARFMPHLPLSTDYFTDECVATFSSPQNVFRFRKARGAETPMSLIMLNYEKPDRTKIAKSMSAYPNEWSTYQFQPGVEAEVARANCIFRTFNFGGVPVKLLCLEGRVKKGEVLGYTYGESYWVRCRQRPELLYKSGLVVPYGEYTTTYANTAMITPTLRYLASIKQDDLRSYLLTGNIKIAENAYTQAMMQCVLESSAHTPFILQAVLSALLLLKANNISKGQSTSEIIEYLDIGICTLSCLPQPKLKDDLYSLKYPSASGEKIILDKHIIASIKFLLQHNCCDYRLLAPLLYYGQQAHGELLAKALSDYADKKPGSTERLNLVTKAVDIACHTSKTSAPGVRLFPPANVVEALKSKAQVSTLRQ